jgi:prolyl oligopeptidase
LNITKPISYPNTTKTDQVNQFFGTQIPDPYRWLEDDQSQETKAWVTEQNNLTFNYLKLIAQRNRWKNQLESLWNFEKMQVPYYQGEYLYYEKNSGLENQFVVYRRKVDKGALGAEELFLNPNTFSSDGTSSLGTVSFSEDGTLVAYQVSEGGSDWVSVYVMNAITKDVLEKPLTDVKFSGIAWKGTQGIFYSAYDKPDGSQLSAKTDQHKLYYHRLGTDQSEDVVIFGEAINQKRRYVWGLVSKDSKYLFVSAAESTNGNELYVMDLEHQDKGFVPMVSGFSCNAEVVGTDGQRFFIESDASAPNNRLMVAHASNPEQAHWQELIPQTNEVLSVTMGGGFLFAHYLHHAVTKVIQYSYDGTKVQTLELPGLGTIQGLGGRKEDKQLFFGFTNFVTPTTIYSYDPFSGSSELFWKPSLAVDLDSIISTQVFYKSKDGTTIPMFLTYRKDLTLARKNPTLLYGYGGFNVSLTPSFSVSNLVWVLNGGIFAVPNIRGGGEYGKAWHDAGTKMQKQKVFDDFIAAAEYLIDQNYTSQNYLAIRGGSNGGLLVGACMTQRPELFRVALPAVGVLDMLRYHTFTAGAGWAYDYGTAEDSPEMLDYLLAYSPVHNVKPGTAYPATLVTTADHDDRVVPAHSYKFIAELQEKQAGTNPVLIRIETMAGHGAGKPTSKIIEELADIFAFTFDAMGLEKE